MKQISKKDGFCIGNFISGISSRLLFLSLGFFLVMFSWTYLHAASSDYPDRTITFVVPYAPGGMVDTSARAFAEFLQKRLKQSVMVLNKTGGGTTIGGKYVADSKPDGYTLGFFTFSAGVPEAYSYFRQAPYSSDDLKPITQIMSAAITISVKGDAQWNSFKDLIKYAKENPGMKVGTQGSESSGWLLMSAVISKAEGTKFVSVPFRGGTEIIAALLGEHVPIGTPDYSPVRPLREANKIKPLALLVRKRPAFVPDVPTISELGYSFPSALEAPIGLFGPKELPDEIVKKLEGFARMITEDPAFQEVCFKMTMQVDYKDTPSFKRMVNEHNKNLSVLFKEIGIGKK